MANKTSIEWTATYNDDGTVTPGFNWNFLRGCSRVSEGCRNCYAEGVAARFSKPGQPYEGLAKFVDHKPRWTGEIGFIEDVLTQPLRWKKPRKIFVNSMSDLFHEKVTDDILDRAFAVMALTPQHTYQCLTKRPARMLEYFRNGAEKRIAALVYNVTYGQGTDFPQLSSEWRNRNRQSRPDLATEDQGRQSQSESLCEGLSASENGISATAGLFIGNDERGQETSSYGGSSASVGILQRSSDTGQNDDQSQERGQGRQPTGESGTGDVCGEQETRVGSSEHQPEPSAGQQAPQNSSNRSGCVANSQTPIDGHDGQRPSGSIQDNHEGDVRNLHLPDVETHLTFPLTNCWLGVSVEDQKTAEERIPILLDTPAAVRWLSIEPLLGPVDLRAYLDIYVREKGDGGKGYGGNRKVDPRINWVVVGGESGPNARSFDISWARSIMSQCKDAGVPVFMKQVGARPYDSERRIYTPGSVIVPVDSDWTITNKLIDKKGGDWNEWPEDLRIREFPNV